MIKCYIRLVIVIAAAFIAACGGSGNNKDNDNTTPTPIVDGTFRPAVSNSAYNDVLVSCINAETTSSACRLSRLPFIGQETSTPTKADIMARVIVSHPWMATRFSQLLDEMPQDVYLLFRGVTGIAIGADIRPSYYWAVTGAIYLDPADLWLTASERNSISKAPDYRGEFARELAFTSLWRYVQGNDYAWDYYPLDGNVSSRPLNAIVEPMAALLFHELAHANDFIPPALMAQINTQNKPLDQAIAFEDRNISVDLNYYFPLNSELLYDLAAVMFDGETATTAQKLIDAETVGLAFESDGASDDYAYSSLFEDTAMLFEEVMMKYHFNVDRELAFTDSPFTADAGCEAYVVRWGQRNRVGNPVIQARAGIVLQQLLNRNDVSAYFTGIPAPRFMVNGMDWCANLSNFGVANSAKIQKSSHRTLRPTDLRQLDRHSDTHFDDLR